MRIRSIMDWLNMPMPGWPAGLMGAAIVVIGVYDLISAFYVNHISEQGTPIAFRVILAALIIGFGATCACLCTYKPAEKISRPGK